MAEVADKPVEELVETKEVEEKESVNADTATGVVAEDTKTSENEDVEDAETAEAEAADGDAPDADADAEAAGDDTSKFERRIIRQIEYYFGDANLNRDKFLLEQISKDKDGWVPLTVLLTFKRLASLSSDPEVIVSALTKSDEGLIEISEDKKSVRRHPERPIPEHNEERRKEIMSRTAYVKGFPLEITMSELLDFFAPYDKVANITMRKYHDKPTLTYKFKGSIFITFEKKEQTEEFIKKDKVLFKERELIRKWQETYLADKKEELKNKKSSKAKAKSLEADKFELPKGTVLFFEGATDAVTREILREAIEKIKGDYEISYIDFSKGDKDGHIRFSEANVAVKFLEQLEDKKLKLNDDIELTVRSVEGDDEKEYLEKAVEQMKNRRSHHNKHKGGGGGGGNRKRRGGHDHRNGDKKRRND